jgi:predicted site-specific integrase-resolvase
MTETRKAPDTLVVNQQTAAAMLGVSASTLRRWHRAGTGPRVIRVSRLVRYRPADLRRFLRRCERAAPAARTAQGSSARVPRPSLT